MSPLSWVFVVDSVPMTAAVVAGQTSLGGSESACLGLARALRARGHDVTIAATKLANDVPDVDAWGVRWLPAEDLKQAQKLIDPDVCVALRQPMAFAIPIQARYRMLWNQDMLVGDGAKQAVMALAWAYDRVAYVSAYQRKQWEGVCPELAPLGWVTRNGFDPAHVPTDVAKVPGRIIHISRPERAMTPLLAMWPELKKRVPHAELHICRYQSMYDGEGSNVKAMVEAYDREIARVQAEVGGIVTLGQLNKPDLYRAIASAEVMWYPGVVDFAETSCIAAIEAQACGTPFVGSYKGALPETVPHGVLVPGDAMSPAYQADSVAAVVRELEHVGDHWVRVAMGRQHVSDYTYEAIAKDWEAHVWDAFDARATAQREKVVDALLHEDDHVAAYALTTRPDVRDECVRIMRGEAQTAEQYGQFALDPEEEMTTKKQARHATVVEAFQGCERILDLACGNGAFAILLAEASPTRIVHAYDYSSANIEAATQAAERHGVADRVTFRCTAVCDLETGRLVAPLGRDYDGVFLGEFCEHVAGVETLLTEMATALGPDVRVVITVPSGPFGDMLPVAMPKQKGHVHHFRPRDLDTMFAGQTAYTRDYLDCDYSPRGAPLGHWIVRYCTGAQPIAPRPLSHWHRTIRPKQTLSVGILAHNSAADLAKCLSLVYPIADEIVIADCGSEIDTDELTHLAERYRAVGLGLPRVSQFREGFAGARNVTLEHATGDWFLWIDCDEQLVGVSNLRKYLESGVFRGYALKQNHLMLDALPHFDTPVRVFRRGPDIQFYGCVHEQPQMGHCNGDILPTLQLHDVQIAHTGYLHEGIRRQKSQQRNLPLLVRDREVFADRQLGHVLWIRDYVTQADWRREGLGGQPDALVYAMWRSAIELFETHFLDPAHRYHAIARPFYEAAVQHVRGAIEIQHSFGGQVGGLKGKGAKPSSFWVRVPEHIAPLMAYHQRQALKVFDTAPLDVEPVTQPTTELVA